VTFGTWLSVNIPAAIQSLRDWWGQNGQPIFDAIVSAINSIIGAIQSVIAWVGRAIEELGKMKVVGGSVGVPGGYRPPARAMGGPVDWGRGYVVGEYGPELFVPRQSGTIVPNNQIAQQPIDYDRLARIVRDAVLQVAR